ncbi:MAG: 5-formyltetrahydrofolate cyclo-ligase [Anaerovoracaceae bacterium]|nr:5-formyltetrahydrofolate cyclo-ligase [Bacillota bacterium]MDY2670262.1 5-formyltetrahydrofolate cyclo-ligase [Anaerovoracaceae bacterium]
MSISSEKSQVRKSVIHKRSALTPAAIEECAEKRLMPLAGFIEKLTGKKLSELTVMSFMSYNTEFPTRKMNQLLLDKGARLAVPYTSPDFQIISCIISSMDDLKLSKMGIPEPDPAVTEHIKASDADIILMPGAAFDKGGGRLGYGKGCYDRFLAESAGKLPPLAALTWSLQIVDSVPQDENDLKVDYLFTEDSIIACR